MSVFVSIEDQEGEGLAPVVDVDRLHRRFGRLSEGVCLRFVSEEEDASFNQLQLPLLVAELDQLGEAADLSDVERDELTRVLRLCRRFQDKRGVHARFYGERGRGE